MGGSVDGAGWGDDVITLAGLPVITFEQYVEMHAQTLREWQKRAGRKHPASRKPWRN
jgi:hypothetical protein